MKLTSQQQIDKKQQKIHHMMRSWASVAAIKFTNCTVYRRQQYWTSQCFCYTIHV